MNVVGISIAWAVLLGFLAGGIYLNEHHTQGLWIGILILVTVIGPAFLALDR